MGLSNAEETSESHDWLPCFPCLSSFLCFSEAFLTSSFLSFFRQASLLPFHVCLSLLRAGITGVGPDTQYTINFYKQSGVWELCQNSGPSLGSAQSSLCVTRSGWPCFLSLGVPCTPAYSRPWSLCDLWKTGLDNGWT